MTLLAKLILLAAMSTANIQYPSICNEYTYTVVFEDMTYCNPSNPSVGTTVTYLTRDTLMIRIDGIPHHTYIVTLDTEPDYMNP